MNEQQNDAVIELITNAFLMWELPESVRADNCAIKQGYGRTGTNLLSFSEAEQMFRDLVLPELAALRAENAEQKKSLAERDAFKFAFDEYEKHKRDNAELVKLRGYYAGIVKELGHDLAIKELRHRLKGWNDEEARADALAVENAELKKQLSTLTETKDKLVIQNRENWARADALDKALASAAKELEGIALAVEQTTGTPREDWGVHQSAITFLLNWHETRIQDMVLKCEDFQLTSDQNALLQSTLKERCEQLAAKDAELAELNKELVRVRNTLDSYKEACRLGGDELKLVRLQKDISMSSADMLLKERDSLQAQLENKTKVLDSAWQNNSRLIKQLETARTALEDNVEVLRDCAVSLQEFRCLSDDVYDGMPARVHAVERVIKQSETALARIAPGVAESKRPATISGIEQNEIAKAGGEIVVWGDHVVMNFAREGQHTNPHEWYRDQIGKGRIAVLTGRKPD